MDFSIETGNLQKAIKLLSVTAKMNIKDIEGMILIQANQDNSVTFFSNNKGTALSYTADKVDISTPGSAIIEYAQIKSFASAFHPWKDESGVKDFHFSLKDNRLNVTLKNVYENGKVSKGSLKLMVYKTYNIRIPKSVEAPTLILNSTIFRAATSKVMYAINPSIDSAFIQGMNVNFDEDHIYFVGTTGTSLSEYKVKNISDLSEGNYTLKYDFMMGLRRALGEETQIAFEFTDREIKAAFDNVCFWGTLIIGHDFPNYKPVLESYEHKIMLDKDVLLSNILPLQDVLNADDNFRLTFSIENRTVTFSCDTAAFTYDGEVDFDDKYVIDLDGQRMVQTIEVIKDDKILLLFSDENGVLLFDSGNFEDQRALLAPIRRR